MSALQDLIPVVNRLQDIVTQTSLTGLDLPLLAVVGSQSAGKSSVLENIVGKDFLPRGTGIVTRRPLVLQLINLRTRHDSTTPATGESTGAGKETSIAKSPEGKENVTGDSQVDNSKTFPGRNSYGEVLAEYSDASSEDAGQEDKKGSGEWAEFLHIPGKKFYDFGEVRREIERETARVAGRNKGISRVPINLKVYSPNVLDLTMVDLPGLTKIPIGDQPTDIERQVKTLVLEYISKANAIILAVTPANGDLANSEALKLANQVDPSGIRTVGVLSKLDLMDPGTDASDVLAGNVYPLRLGFVGVVNRSQRDIVANKPMAASRASEAEFFASHPAYAPFADHCGTEYLARKLNSLLMQHIRRRLPDIKARLNTLIAQTEKQLALYGGTSSDPSDSSYSIGFSEDGTEPTKETRAALILQLLTQFASSFVDSIEGTSTELSTKQLCGGARIYYVYNTVLGRQLSKIDPLQGLTRKDIRTAIRNSTGPRPSLFVPELAFDLLVKPQIGLLEQPAHRCVQLVYEELLRVTHRCGPPQLQRYPHLQTKLLDVVSQLLRDRLRPTSRYVQSLIDINRAYINTNHPSFIGAANAMSAVVHDRQKANNTHHHKASTVKTSKSSHLKSSSVSDTKSDDKKANKAAPTPIKDTNQNKNAKNNANAELTNTSHILAGSAGDVSRRPDRDTFLNFFFGRQNEEQSKTPNTSKQDITGNTSADLSQFPQASQLLMSSTPEASFEGNSTTTVQIEDGINDLSVEDDGATEREDMECELIRRLIVSYFAIVRQTIQDQVPKAIMHLLVNYSKNSVQNVLVQKLYKESLFDDLLREDETVVKEREKYRNLLHTYKEAAAVISEVI